MRLTGFGPIACWPAAAAVTTLERMGVLDDTYLIYTSDNGYSIGNHGRYAGRAASAC